MKKLIIIFFLILISNQVFGSWNIFSPETPPPIHYVFSHPWFFNLNNIVYFNSTHLNLSIAQNINDTHIKGTSPWLYDDFVYMYFNVSNLNQYLNSIGAIKYTVGPYLYNSTNFIYFNETKLNNTIKQLDTNTEKYGGGPYLYNDSTTIYLNETKLINTISIYDTDSHIEGTSPWLYDDFVYMYFNETHFNLSVQNFLDLLDKWVNESGDTMYGNLNMSNNNITDVDYLFVHNISGRSPLYLNADAIILSTPNGTPIATFTPTNYTQWGNNFGDIVARTITVDRLIINDLLNYSNTEAPDIWYADEIYINKFNFTFYFNETRLNNTLSNYIITNNITDTQKYGGGPYLYNDSNTIYLNESKLNSTIIQIADIKSYEEIINVNVISGKGSNVSTNLKYLLTQIIVTPPSTPVNYRFYAYETNTLLTVDENRIPHKGVWNIYKQHSLNSSVTVNITTANIDGVYQVKLKYIDNIIQV